MIGIFVRAVIFGLGVELGRELYKTVKTKAIEAAEAKKSPPALHTTHEKNRRPSVVGAGRRWRIEIRWIQGCLRVRRERIR